MKQFSDFKEKDVWTPRAGKDLGWALAILVFLSVVVLLK